jgi:hypothetical protein
MIFFPKIRVLFANINIYFKIHEYFKNTIFILKYTKNLDCKIFYILMNDLLKDINIRLST